jgi:ubiquinone/menaquinone biosynthesis C-methylase UbiE
MNIKDNTFDTVIDTFALEYYANPDKALNGI